MVLKKEELSFLSIFQSLSNRADTYGNKVFVEIEDTKAIFYMANSIIGVFKEVELPQAEPNVFFNSFDINDLNSILSGISDNETITIDGNGVKFGKSFFKFPIDITPSPYKKTFVNFLKEKKDAEQVNLKGLNKINLVKPFVLFKEPPLAAVIYRNGVYGGIARRNFGIASENSDLTKDVHFNSSIINFISSQKIENLDISFLDNDNYWSFCYEGINVFVPNSNFKIPNFKDEKVVNLYEHKDYIVFNRAELLESLKRLNFAVKKNNRENVSFIMKKDFTILEVVGDIINAKEQIQSKLSDSTYENNYFEINLPILIEMLSLLNEEEVIFRIRFIEEGDSSPFAIKIFNKDKEDGLFYVLVCYEKIKKIEE